MMHDPGASKCAVLCRASLRTSLVHILSPRALPSALPGRRAWRMPAPHLTAGPGLGVTMDTRMEAHGVVHVDVSMRHYSGNVLYVLLTTW